MVARFFDDKVVAEMSAARAVQAKMARTRVLVVKKDVVEHGMVIYECLLGGKAKLYVDKPKSVCSGLS